MTDSVCPGCGSGPCHCWRALERERVATTPVEGVTWPCSHRKLADHPEKAHTPGVANQWWFGHRSIRPQP